MVLTAGGFANVFDVHTHLHPLGPTGPVTSGQGLILPANAQNSSAKLLIVN